MPKPTARRRLSSSETLTLLAVRILGMIPARGGSKGVPRKNVYPLGGKPLIAWTIEAAARCPEITDLIVSTDDEEITRVALEYGCKSLRRPTELAQDDTASVDVAIHMLRTAPMRYDRILMLQPTSPLRDAADIQACLGACAAGAPACVSVVRATEPPSWMFTRKSDGVLEPVIPRELIPLRRQDMAPVFLLNGAVYVANADWLEMHRRFHGPGVHGYEMPADRSIDIDTVADFEEAEKILLRNKS